jgi:DNA-binding LacI/PurR family transcriptional regulator/anti-anti-sigma regulatory factor
MSGHRTIGIVESDLVGFYYRSVLLGAHAVARAHGVQCITFHGSLQELHASQLAIDAVDGWIVVLPTEDIKDLAWGDIPLVTVDAWIPELGYPAVLPDNHGGIALAVHHLLDHGHERVGFVGYLEQSDIQQRYAGYQAALAERGIPFTSELVFAASDNVQSGGRAAGQRFLEAGGPCTALVVATDLNAIGVMETLQAAGYRIPADVAIVGFDNIATAQYASPPLATVGQQFAALGRTAAQLLLDQIAGRDVPLGITHTPTTLIPRRSCGCSGAEVLAPMVKAGDYTTPDWQDMLTQELARLAYYPLPLDLNPAAQHLWPGRTTLVRALDAALNGRPMPADAELERAWQEVSALTTEMSQLQAIWKLLKRAGTQQRAARPDDTGMQERLTAFLDQAAIEMMRAQQVVDLAERAYLDGLVQTNYRISTRLLAEELDTTQQLTWLGQVGVQWGCLGLWTESDSDGPAALTVAGFYGRDTNTEALLGNRYMAAHFPPTECLPVSARDGGPDMVVLLPVRTAARDWGVLVLCTPIEGHLSLALDYMGMWATLMGSALDRGSMVASMKEQQETLRIGYERERALAQTIRELGCPIIPLLPGVLLIPLIGVISSDRARHMLESVLQGVSDHQAQTVLLDITGVPVVDTQVANTLIRVARTASLLGSRVILVGIRPEIAQSIVGLGISLESLATQSTLAAAVEALQYERNRGQRDTPRYRLG